MQNESTTKNGISSFMKDKFKLFANVLMRIVAVFTAQALSVIGAGAVAGVSTIKAMSVAGITAVATVIEKLARGFMNDGKLDINEINAAFSAVDTKAKTVADVAVEERRAADKTAASKSSAETNDDPDYN